eukprot:5889115-Prymnesium_polylepis.1
MQRGETRGTAAGQMAEDCTEATAEGGAVSTAASHMTSHMARVASVSPNDSRCFASASPATRATATAAATTIARLHRL